MQCDLYLGFVSSVLDQWLANLYSITALQGSLFSGSVIQQVAALDAQVSADWAVKSAPTAVLNDPGTLWQQAIGPNGTSPSQVTNAFTLEFPALYVSLAIGSAPAQSTTLPVTVIVQAAVSGAGLQITPLGVVVNLSGSSPDDQTAYQYLIIPQVLQIAQGMLAPYALPQIAPLGVPFTSPVLGVGNGFLSISMNLAGRGVAPVADLDSAPQPLFLLFSPPAVQQLAQGALDTVVGRPQGVSGSTDFTVGHASYNASVTLNSVSVSTTGDPTLVSVSADVGASASAEAKLLFIPVGIGYDASVKPSPVTMQANLTASNNGIAIAVGPMPAMFILLSPTGDISSEILSGIAWPLTTIMVNALQPLASTLLVAYNPYTVASIPIQTLSISGQSITVNIGVGSISPWNGMALAAGSITLG